MKYVVNLWLRNIWTSVCGDRVSAARNFWEVFKEVHAFVLRNYQNRLLGDVSFHNNVISIVSLLIYRNIIFIMAKVDLKLGNAINTSKWLDENKASFVPPVCNKLM